MNLVRFGLIITFAALAGYAMLIYSQVPPPQVIQEPTTVKRLVPVPAPSPVVLSADLVCPVVKVEYGSGAGAITIAVLAIAGLIGVAFVDVFRKER